MLRTLGIIVFWFSCFAVIACSGGGATIRPVESSEVSETDSPSLPPPLPQPSAAFVAYTPEGFEEVESGPGLPVYQDRIMAILPQLAQYGFGRYVSPNYQGLTRSQEECRAFFAPLVAAGKSNGVKFVPGMWLQSIIRNLYGSAREEPWNVTGPEAELNHPMNPIALIEPPFWEDLVLRARILAIACESDQVFIDCEFVFWKHRDHTFWTDENLAAIRALARQAIAQLQSEGIFLSLYHPALKSTVFQMRRIAKGIFAPQDEYDPFHSIEWMGTAPYYSQATWTIEGPEAEYSLYSNNGFVSSALRFCLASDHIQQGPSIGYTTAQVKQWQIDHPQEAQKIWFFTNNWNFERHAWEFGALAGP